MGTALKMRIENLDGQGILDVPNTRGLGIVKENGQSNGLRNLMQLLQKESTALHAACATEKAACAKRLL